MSASRIMEESQILRFYQGDPTTLVFKELSVLNVTAHSICLGFDDDATYDSNRRQFIQYARGSDCQLGVVDPFTGQVVSKVRAKNPGSNLSFSSFRYDAKTGRVLTVLNHHNADKTTSLYLGTLDMKTGVVHAITEKPFLQASGGQFGQGGSIDTIISERREVFVDLSLSFDHYDTSTLVVVDADKGTLVKKLDYYLANLAYL